ncbi:MAG: hypothetical protein KJ749_12570 [Planctomycetes bacterium]|nr:hypothetical protein [Planctomycetota bacterium]
MKRALLLAAAAAFCLGSAALATNLNVTVVGVGPGCESSSITVEPGCEFGYRVIGELSDGVNEGLALAGFDLEFDGGNLGATTTPTTAPMNNFVKPAGITNPIGYGGTVQSGNLIQVGGGKNTIMNGRVPCVSNADCPTGVTCLGTNFCDVVAPFPTGTVITGVAQPGVPVDLATGMVTAPMTEGTYTLQVTNLFANVIQDGEDGNPFYKTEAAGTPAPTNLTVTVLTGAGCCAEACAIGASNPPSGAIDARQPNPVDNDPANPQGWQAVALTFVSCSDTSGMGAGDFTVTEVSGTAPVPVISSVEASTNPITLHFSSPLEPGAWTVITHNASGTKVCLGYLPGDTNQDKLVATADISYLIDCINLVATCAYYQTDIDRSNVTNPSDILREIDLLNGAGDLGTWITQSLPVSPCD